MIETRFCHLGSVLYPGVVASAMTFSLNFGVIRMVRPRQTALLSLLVTVVAMGLSTVRAPQRVRCLK
ncbi:hypothetical protein KNJ79_06340 [Sphingopyxis indica]|uniref:hypothetical protein n=1 Tax=Sphingopyxis indica TaxID=436663 RepID=UPI0029390B4F|nr:hypothetical protein [Sphingopyxis indica]WOF44539.1 hypothetical protein KNJ79_06340 [Sphingopyxis indica]